MTQDTYHGFKVGDEVFIDKGSSFGRARPMRLATVEKVTRTQFVAGGIRFKPKGGFGYEVGSGLYYGATARHADEELRAEQAFLVAQADASSGLAKVADRLQRLSGQEAIDAFAAMPQSIRDLAGV